MSGLLRCDTCGSFEHEGLTEVGHPCHRIVLGAPPCPGAYITAPKASAIVYGQASETAEITKGEVVTGVAFFTSTVLDMYTKIEELTANVGGLLQKLDAYRDRLENVEQDANHLALHGRWQDEDLGTLLGQAERLDAFEDRLKAVEQRQGEGE